MVAVIQPWIASKLTRISQIKFIDSTIIELMRKLTELNYIIFNKYNKIFIKNKNIFQIYRFFLKLNRDSL